MKHTIRILMCAAAVAGYVACEEKPKTLPEKIEDGLNTRPNEKLKDAGEDVKDAAKDTKDAVKDAVK